MGFRSSLCAVVLAAFCGVTLARADAIQKWRTPDGALYFGDRPPQGSTLVETIADSPRGESVAAPPLDANGELARAAAEGRDIIRRREEARTEAMRVDAEREARADEVDAWQPSYETPLWIIDNTPPCAVGELCFDGDRRPHRHHHDDWGRGDWRRSDRGWQRDWRSGWNGGSSRYPPPSTSGARLLSPAR